MFIIKKKFKALEKRIADLEGQIQSQRVILPYDKEFLSRTGIPMPTTHM